ncbi:four helix bundle protein [Candidatus Bipolaricaulota bacterium]|nr:four helix bundle protein [Candidatus Bipolaricaulota bacterium]
MNKGTGPEAVRNLQIWQEGMAIVREVYRLTQSWPKEESYGLTAQARRAAVSIPANLAEGLGRGTPGEISRFAQTALGSAYELDTLLQIATELGYVKQSETQLLRESLCQLIKRISAFIRYQEERR